MAFTVQLVFSKFMIISNFGKLKEFLFELQFSRNTASYEPKRLVSSETVHAE